LKYRPVSQISVVQGRLKQYKGFWRETLHTPPPILECIENGYRLPLKFVPTPYSRKNHKSAELHSEFVDEAIQSLIENCCVLRVQENPVLYSPLEGTKLHLVLNLRYLNQFQHVLSFKYEDLRIAALMFEHTFLSLTSSPGTTMWRSGLGTTSTWGSVGIGMVKLTIMHSGSSPLDCPQSVTCLLS